jgi:hypothetical protein
MVRLTSGLDNSIAVVSSALWCGYSTLSTSVMCGPPMSWTNAGFDGFTGLHGVDAALSQHAPVEEGVAGPIREFNEPEAFVRVEPLDDAVDWRTGRCLEPGLAETGSSSESPGLRLVVIVEFATPRMPKILISQLCFLGGWWPISSVERRWVALGQI